MSGGGLTEWLAENPPPGEFCEWDHSAPQPRIVNLRRIRIPRIKLVLGKGQRRNRRRRLARTAPFVPFSLRWAGNVEANAPGFSSKSLFESLMDGEVVFRLKSST